MKIAAAKDALSALLRHVRRGGRVRIFDRDEPVADLVPVEPGQAAGGRALLGWLVRRGIARPPLERGPIPKELWKPGPVPKRRGDILRALLAERREARR
ncbi:MAG: prevent-host-death protein [Planctomycetes bacterium]|nr:prevent-host-death protein [Planctomycetota bacterium]